MTGLTATGFQIKRLPEIKSDIEAALVQAFGDVDLRAESVFGQLVGISAEYDAILWQLAEQVYFSQYPDSAAGVALDHVCALVGVTRLPARSTQVSAVCYGDQGAVISAGREATNRRTGDVYRVTASQSILPTQAVSAVLSINTNGAGDYTVTVDGTDYTYTSPGAETDQQILTAIQAALSGSSLSTSLTTGELTVTSDDAVSLALTANLSFGEIGVLVPFAAVETGPKALPVGDLTEIKTPVAGWDRITNLEPGVIGANRESDGELRARRSKSIQITATSTLDSITARLRQVANVSDVNVSQNNTDTTDAFGTLRQHVWATVEGGDDADIAAVLFNAVAAGIGYRGDTTVGHVSEVTGKTYQIAFDRPTYIDPTIEVQYIRLSGFPPEGEELIRAALVARTFALGERLVVPRLYTPINTVEGVDIEALLVNGTGSNITPDPNEKIRILSGNITLTDLTP